MSITADAAGLQIQTFDVILEETIVSLGSTFALTPEQTERMRTSLRSVFGNFARIDAEREAALQEAILAMYRTLSWDSEDTALDGVVRILGVERTAALPSSVIGPATGTNGTVITDGLRVQYNPTGTIFTTSGGPFTIAGGTVDITVIGDTGIASAVAVNPDTGYQDWTILDTLAGWSDVGAFESASQPVLGTPIEQDAALRARGAIEAYRRGQGPLAAIEAALFASTNGVRDVPGLTFARAWENTGDPTEQDINGIFGRSIAIVVEGGTDADIVAAILRSRPASIRLQGTDIDVLADLGNGRTVPIRADRVTEVPIWINAVATSSTSEETPPADLTGSIEARLLEQGPLLFGIGDDVTAYKLATSCADIPGFDDLTITLSLDNGVGDAFSGAKRPMSITQRATFADVRIVATED